MIYLKSFELMDPSDEERFIRGYRRTCFDSFYPMQFFPQMKQLQYIEFDNITIFCGGNGSGKSTLLNIIAEKLQLQRNTSFNKTAFFDPYISSCQYELDIYDAQAKWEFQRKSKIITSDDVFSHIIDVRVKNDNIDFRRNAIFEEQESASRWGISDNDRVRSIDFSNPDSVEDYKNYGRKIRFSKGMSASNYVRRSIGIDERTYSNGENGFKYFTEEIQPGGLYLLDEPENSLSAEMQLELVQFIQSMARFYNCQFIMSSHSPFILSIPSAKIYNMDDCPVTKCKWTDLPNVRLYYDFFESHRSEFE